MASASWNDEQRRSFIMIYRDALNGSTADNGLKKTEWTQVLSSFNTSMQCNYTKSQLQSQLQQLKSKYLIFKEIVDNSGFGWDPVTKIPTAPDDVWVRYLSAHPKAREYRNTTLPLYEELEEIFAGRSATGVFAVSSLTSVLPLSQVGGSVTTTTTTTNDDDDGEDEDEVENDRSLSINTSVNSSCSGTVAGTTKKKRKINEIAEALNNLAETNKKGMSKFSELAISMFSEKHKQNFSAEERVKVKTHFAKDSNQAQVYLTCDDEEQIIFLNNILNN